MDYVRTTRFQNRSTSHSMLLLIGRQGADKKGVGTVNWNQYIMLMTNLDVFIQTYLAGEEANDNIDGIRYKN